VRGTGLCWLPCLTSRLTGGLVCFIFSHRTEADPVLRYKHFFCNACNSGRDYIENFAHASFIYTKDTCEIQAATKIFVEEYLKKCTIAEVVQKLNDSQAGGPNANDMYGYKDF
jgi:hypothetical protein